MVQELGFDSIDLNCGCPVHKVVDKNGGAALLKDLPLLERLSRRRSRRFRFRSRSRCVRVGFASTSTSWKLARSPKRSGAAYICLHARTQTEFFTPEVHWEHIRQLKESRLDTGDR